MANGDLAATAGLAVFSEAQNLNEGSDNDNIRGDEIADHILNGGHDWSKIAGRPTTYPASDNSVGTQALKDGAVRTAKIRDHAVTTAKLAFGAVTFEELGEGAVTASRIRDAAVAERHFMDGVVSMRAIEPGAVTYTRIADEAVGWDKLTPGVRDAIEGTTSSLRYKEHIQDAEIDPASVLELRPVTYHRKSAPAGEREIGLIAEEVAAAGVDDLVVWRYGMVDGVRYDRLAVTLLAVVQAQETRIAALEAALTAQEVPTDGA